ncbi:Ger(x)C family spore germination protein [Paenibacillus nanensis]|uniref:Ger(X)C family spore germination protein n=1 Tax=Paenibacillus nanensis TaxID=393251 RepID=A0A3A1UX34_9BACL|nr:Ger(x)C family spore germination protein [Paenibacillus nanensis]RIX49910.1 Ger(x)C family spore germination protein [Paenibacillus nanensis]
MKLVRWLLLLMILLLTGCWNRVELNDIAIISATGIDWKDGKWILSYQVVIPRAISSQTGESGTAAVNVFSTSGDNFRFAISKASEELSRRLYFSHNQIVIIGQEAARRGIGPLMEVYLRNHDSRETVSVFLSRSDARGIMEQLIPLEQIPGAAIQRLIVNEEIGSSAFRHMAVHDALMELLGSSKATAIPGLIIAGPGEGTESVGDLGKTTTATKVRLKDLGLIQGDKLVGWVSDEQSKGVMWLSDHVERSTVSFTCADNRKGKPTSSVRILDTSTKLKPIPANGKWIVKADVEASGVLMEYNCSGDPSKPQEVEKIEKRIEEEIKGIMTDGWEAVRKHKADVLGFGALIHKRYPKQWREASANWEELFPQTEVEITVKMRLSSTGMSNQNFKEAQKKAES